MQNQCFQKFETNISHIPLPEKFTFPFYYEPHELSEIAAQELQNYLENQKDFTHNFGLGENLNTMVIGKMFGILVVQNKENQLGYLAAFSGKLAESNYISFFVPPVFNTLQEDGFYKIGEQELNRLNAEIEQKETTPEFTFAKNNVVQTKLQAQGEIATQKQNIKKLKIERDLKRIDTQQLSENEKLEIEKKLSEKSKKESIILKKITKFWNQKITEAETDFSKLLSEINLLKERRKAKSAQLQQQLFENYSFLNQNKELKSLGKIFNQNPPAGAGECAAPKLLQYAFQNKMKPIAMAEFWWGQSPKSEVRKHKQFYPACTGKCEPILEHMLHGIPLDENPFLKNAAEGKSLKIIYEDNYLLAVNKPEEFLSVPGKLVQDSVQERVKKSYSNSLIVHRLDMSTSGIILIAKNQEIYKKLQSQFIKRQVKKRYVALLNGLVKNNSGTINLPLRVDLDNRPFQMVCYEYGKLAQTNYEVIWRKNGQTLVHFYPITGRTHQLRVHASHQLGLNCPIVGDDLYGTKSNRLHLHAEQIIFTHPITKEIVTLTSKIEF